MSNKVKILMVLLAISYSLFSCRYQEIADAEYPDQVVYMPAVKNGVYYVTESPSTYDVPTSGHPYSYYITPDSNFVIVPLGVYRAGISHKGEYNVHVLINNDTVTNLIASGDLTDVQVLPIDKFLIPDNVTIKNGEDHVTFNLAIDIDFFKQYPGKEFGLGVQILSNKIKVDSLLNTTIVVIDSDIIKP